MKIGFLTILNILIILSIYKADATEYYVTCRVSDQIQELIARRAVDIVKDLKKNPNIKDEINLGFSNDFTQIVLADLGIDLNNEQLEKAKEALKKIEYLVPEVNLRDRLYVKLNLINSGDYGYLVMEITDQKVEKISEQKLNALSTMIQSQLNITKRLPYVVVANYKLTDVKKLEAISKYCNEYNKLNSEIAIFISSIVDDQKIINTFTLYSYAQGWFLGGEKVIASYRLKTAEAIQKEKELIDQCNDLIGQVSYLTRLV